MMKKYIFLIVIYFLFIPVVSAYAPYNYEISEMNLTGNIISIKGWGRMNGGTCINEDGECFKSYKPQYRLGDKNMYAPESPNYTDKDRGYKMFIGEYGSGWGNSKGVTSSKNSNCKESNGGKDYTYRYSLAIVPYDNKGNRINGQIIKIDMDQNDSRRPKIDLTFSSCPKESGKACSKTRDYVSACYLDVGFYFEFATTSLKSGYNYILELTVKNSGFNRERSMTFPMGIYQDKLGKNDKLRSYVIEASVQKAIKLAANKPNLWNDDYYTSGKSIINEITNGTKFYKDPPSSSYQNKILGTTLVNNETWYHVLYRSSNYNQEGWLPASWIESADPNPMQINIPNTINDMAICDNSINGPAKEEFDVDVCSEKIYSIDKNSTQSICKTDKTTYYSKSCSEKIDTKFTPVAINNLKKNNYAQYKVYVESYRSCSYTFNANEWNTKYNYYNEASKNPNNSDEQKAQIEKNLNYLKQYIKDYDSLRSFKYDYDPIVSFSINNKLISTTAVNDFKKDNNNDSNVEVIKNLTTTNCVTLADGKTRVCDYKPKSLTKENSLKFSGNVTLSAKMTETGEKDLSINVMGLGENKSWSIKGKCTVKVDNQDYYYRSIDVGNPFDFRNENTCDSNWCNDNYDFTNIINSKTWDNVSDSNSAYVFYLTTNNITEIKKSNKNDIADKYIGNDCKKSSIGELQCNFIRDKNNFSEVYINGEKQ